ncbi:hypothetical protein J6V86_00885 [bacterium]|nr:hypothetical protein [bacterium]
MGLRDVQSSTKFDICEKSFIVYHDSIYIIIGSAANGKNETLESCTISYTRSSNAGSRLFWNEKLCVEIKSFQSYGNKNISASEKFSLERLFLYQFKSSTYIYLTIILCSLNKSFANSSRPVELKYLGIITLISVYSFSVLLFFSSVFAGEFCMFQVFVRSFTNHVSDDCRGV